MLRVHGRRGIVCFVCMTVLTLLAAAVVMIPYPNGIKGSNGRTRSMYAELPISFEPNRGQADPKYTFIAQGPSYGLSLTANQAAFHLRNSAGMQTLVMKFRGADAHATQSGHRRLPGESNYFKGEPSNWITHVPTYAEVHEPSIYPGVDISWYGNSSTLEYDLIVHPGANPKVIDIAFDGSSRLRLSDGDLLITVAGQELRQKRPIAYQDVGGSRRPVAAQYALLEQNRIGFKIGAYDPSAPLIIDPQLLYSLFLGWGSASQTVALDSAGNLLVAGSSFSDFVAGNDTTNAFVMKLNPTGTAILYRNEFGAAGLPDAANALATDASGNVYVTGSTSGAVNFPWSIPFPTVNPIQPTHTNGNPTAFVTKFDASGRMVYSTTLGGSTGDTGTGIAVDSLGNMYVTGITSSIDFPTSHPLQRSLAGGTDAFVSALNAQGSAFIYSTYVGGSENDYGNGIALDRSANAYVTGYTQSPDFPTLNSFAMNPSGSGGAFLFKLNPAGSAFQYSTYLAEGQGNGVAVDASGNAYVVGSTTANPNTDVFVKKVNSTGTGFVYATHLGGRLNDAGTGIAIDAAGDAYITGMTSSGDFPQVLAVETSNSTNPSFDVAAFATKLDLNGTVNYSTLLFGARGNCGAFNSGTGIVSDTNGTVYVTGNTGSLEFPTTPSAVNGGFLCSDAFTGGPFVVKLANDTTSSTAISLIQSNSVQGTGVGSVSAAFPSSTQPGDMIIAFVRMSTTSQAVTVTDNAGNSYVDAVSQGQTSDGHQVHIFYAKNIKGGAAAVTAAFSGVNTHPWLAIYEYSGLTGVDQTARAQGSNSSPFSGLITTTNPNELEFTAAGLPASYTGNVAPGSGYALQMQDTGTSRAANETAILSQNNNNYAGRFNLSSATNWSIVVATFIGGSSALQISSTGIPDGTLNQPYSAQLSASGGTAPYSWALLSSNGYQTFPQGLTLNSSTGVISGTAMQTGWFTFVVSVTDAAGHTVYKIFNLTIPAPPLVSTLQTNSIEGSGLGSISLAFKSNNNQHGLIVAVVRMSTTSESVTVKDSAGNTYIDAVSQVQTIDGSQIHLFYAKDIVGGPNSVTATFSNTNNHPWLSVYEFAGLSTTNPIEQTLSAQGSGTSVSAGTISTNGALAFVATGLPASFTGSVSAGSRLTLALQDTGTSRGATETAAVGAGQITGSFSLSSAANWSAVFATFKQ